MRSPCTRPRYGFSTVFRPRVEPSRDTAGSRADSYDTARTTTTNGRTAVRVRRYIVYEQYLNIALNTDCAWTNDEKTLGVSVELLRRPVPRTTARNKMAKSVTTLHLCTHVPGTRWVPVHAHCCARSNPRPDASRVFR